MSYVNHDIFLVIMNQVSADPIASKNEPYLNMVLTFVIIYHARQSAFLLIHF
jgi:hypothetical protein